MDRVVKVCINCVFRELKRKSKCPIMETPPQGECFGFCADYDEWRRRLDACKKYARREGAK